MKITDVRVGEIIKVDSGFTCCKEGRYEVYGVKDTPSSYYFYCDSGYHFLDGQIDHENNDELVGISPA